MRRITFGAAIIVCSVLIFSVVHAHPTIEPGDDGSATASFDPRMLHGPTEVAFVSMACSDSGFGGFLGATFKGTSGFLVNPLSLSLGNFDGFLLCAEIVDALVRSAKESGCVTTPVLTDPSSGRLFIGFDFVCHGSRNAVVKAIADFGFTFFEIPATMASGQ